MGIEIPLSADLRHIAQRGQIVRNGVGPAGSQFPKKPVLVERFHILGYVLQFVLQHGVAVLQGISKVEMELTVIAVHLVTLLGIEFPDFLRLHNVEPARVFLVEVLHPGRMVEALIVIRKHLIPAGGAAVLHRFQHQVSFHHLAGDLVIKPFQDTLMDSGEDIARKQGFDLLLVKAGGQLQLLLHTAAELQQSGMVLPVLPLMDHAIAVGLVGLREEPLQSLEHTGTHGLG